MSVITLTPKLQIQQPQPQQSHPKLSQGRVLWVRYLRWLDKTSLPVILKTLRRVVTVLAVSLAFAAPQFFFGLLFASARSHGLKILLYLGLLYVTLNGKRLWVRLTTRQLRMPAGNQHTLHGLPVGEFASYLKETKTFKRDEAIKTLGLSQGRYHAIVKDLKNYGVLFPDKAQGNAMTLRDISLANLVEQLRALAEGKVPPLIWDPERELWVGRDGPFNRWVLSKEFERRKLSEETERAERRLDRVKRQTEKLQEQAASPFAQVFAQLPIGGQ